MCCFFSFFPTFFYFEFIQWTSDGSDHEGVAEDKEFALQTVKRKYIFMKFMWKLISTTERKKGKKKIPGSGKAKFPCYLKIPHYIYVSPKFRVTKSKFEILRCLSQNSEILT